MLTNSFIHIDGVGEIIEKRIWGEGAQSWLDFLSAPPKFLSYPVVKQIYRELEKSMQALEEGDIYYFKRTLPPRYHWRLYPEFKDHICFFDIETTGLSAFQSHITTVACYDGKQTTTFVRGENLHDLPDHLKKYKVLSTFNGKMFDVPFVEQEMKIRLGQPNIDLMHVLKGLGYKGGLKACENKLGIGREELKGVDGRVAIALWQCFKETKDRDFLDTMLAYNVEDAVNLQRLLVICHNMRLEQYKTLEIDPLPEDPKPDCEYKINMECLHLSIKKIPTYF